MRSSEQETKKEIKKEKLKELSSVTLFITLRCNYSCFYCYLPEPLSGVREVNPQRILEGLRKSRLTLDLLGGEPFLEKEKLIKIIQHCRTYGLKLRSLSTNGSIYDEDIIKELKTLKDFVLQVSLDAASPKTYKVIRNSPYFSQVLKNTQMFIKAGLNVILSMVLMTKNYQEIEELVKLGEKLEVRGVSFAAFIPLGRGRKKSNWCLSYKQMVQAYRTIKRLKTKLKIIGFEDKVCPAGVSQVDILPNGDIYPCALFFGFKEAKVGNILDKELKFSGSWHQKLVNFQVPKRCTTCPMPPVCYGGCKAAIYSQDREFPQRPKPICLVRD